MAPDSLLDPFRAFTVFWTFLMHRQKRFVWDSFAIPISTVFYSLAFPEMSELGINRMTHSRDDLCGIQSYYSQSVGPGRYQTTNLVPNASGVNPVSVNELLIYPREGYGYNNAAIDADS